MARTAAQIGIVRDKAVRAEPDHAGHPADADHAAAAGIDLAGNGVDALAIDDVSKIMPPWTSRVSREEEQYGFAGTCAIHLPSGERATLASATSRAANAQHTSPATPM